MLADHTPTKKREEPETERRRTPCPSAAASAGKACQNANDLVREAVGCTGLLDSGLGYGFPMRYIYSFNCLLLLCETILILSTICRLVGRLLGGCLSLITRVDQAADAARQVLRRTLVGHPPSCASNTGVRLASELMHDRVVHQLR